MWCRFVRTTRCTAMDKSHYLRWPKTDQSSCQNAFLTLSVWLSMEPALDPGHHLPDDHLEHCGVALAQQFPKPVKPPDGLVHDDPGVDCGHRHLHGVQLGPHLGPLH